MGINVVAVKLQNIIPPSGVQEAFEDVNKAIQRSLTKAAARHGLGLYIYAGDNTIY